MDQSRSHFWGGLGRLNQALVLPILEELLDDRFVLVYRPRTARAPLLQGTAVPGGVS